MRDLLIIGSGAAGLCAALAAKEEGASVTVVTKIFPTQAQSVMAQGGMNAALGNVEEDSVEAHIADTLRSAHGLADEVMVQRLCSEAPDAIAWLDRIGVPFSRRNDAATSLESIAQRRLGAASSKRACYAQDYTGLKIMHTLYDQCLKAGIEIISEHCLLNLIVNDMRQVQGATFWDIGNGDVCALEAGRTLIATGGYAELYHGFTTNSYGSSGDGVAAVLRAGGVVSDMEFVQFHPTALAGSAILISESARGEGGYLLDGKGERFTNELAPRDEVARAIEAKLREGEQVTLDIRHLGEETIMEFMPQELHLCRLHAKIDPISEPIPIAPVAHYTMGGIDVDSRFEVTGLSGAYAVGECSNAKIHGANRLGGNSLLEIVVFGRQAALSALSANAVTPEEESSQMQVQLDRHTIDQILQRSSKGDFYAIRNALGRLMYDNAGIVRHYDRLMQAMHSLAGTKASLTTVGIGDKATRHNQNLVDYLGFANSVLLGEAVLAGALWRKESRGAHYREEYPGEAEAFACHTRCSLRGEEVIVHG